MINKAFFYKKSRELGLFGKLSQPQVDSIDIILYFWEQSGFTDKRWLAYMLATTKHETGSTMRPIEEWGKGKGRPYGRKLKHSGVAYGKPNKIYYGRGYVQLTWYENYELMGRLLGIDLLSTPEMALNPSIAAQVMFEGMSRSSSSVGDFTGKCLEMYFNKTTEDWIGARKIINGRDKAALIKGYALKFLQALQ